MYLKPFDATRLATLQALLNQEAKAFLPDVAPLNIADMYGQFSDNWAEKGNFDDYFCCTGPFNSCGDDLAGMDLPILVTRDDPRSADPALAPKDIVMVLAQDPLRHTREFDGAKFGGQLIVGTPFAFHSQRYRAGRMKLYRDVVDSMLDKYDVYLTDVRKLGRRSVTKDGVSGKWQRDVRRDTALLKYEFSIAPKAIILLGNSAADAFAAIEGDLANAPMPIRFPHPGARADAWQAALNKKFRKAVKCDIPHKVEYIRSEISSRLGDG